MMAHARRTSFLDGDGRRWIVEERDGTPPALLFISTDKMRRVTTYPENWYTLSPAELEALSWQR